MTEIDLFTKDPCPLCDDVKALLTSLEGTYPHQLREVDIAQDQSLFLKYRFTIPVLEFKFDSGKILLLKAPITLQDLVHTFSDAGANTN